jgi:tetratricopeptide (TPR) repeat protein
MATWYPGSGLSWEQYLQANSFTQDIREEVARQSRAVSASIADHARQMVGTSEQLAAAFMRGTGDIVQGLEHLGAQFDYSMGLVLDELQVQSDHLRTMVQQLDSIKRTLDSPLLTQARELFRIGCDRLSKGLLDKALQAFLAAEQKNDADFFIEYYLGKLYLYGRDDDDNVVDLAAAKEHLLAAARYGKAEIPVDRRFEVLAAEALFHGSVACYALSETAGSHSSDELRQAFSLVREGLNLAPNLPEAWFHAAKYKALQGTADKALEILEKAIERDPRYAAKALADGAFSRMADELNEFLERLRQRKAAESEAVMKKVAVGERFAPVSPEGARVRDQAMAEFARAQAAHASGTFLGYIEAMECARRGLANINVGRARISDFAKPKNGGRRPRRRKRSSRRKRKRLAAVSKGPSGTPGSVSGWRSPACAPTG